jgi:hypothetical protein
LERLEGKLMATQNVISRHVAARALCLAAILGSASATVQAVDGCKVLLCLAGNWRDISPCRPEVEQALRDVARGRGWPECSMGGSSRAGNTFIAPELCPVQYRTEARLEGVVSYECPFSAVVDAVVDSQPWSRTWWTPAGDSVTEWLPAAKAAFAGDPSAIDDRFDRDYAAWLATLPPAPSPDSAPAGGGV